LIVSVRKQSFNLWILGLLIIGAALYIKSGSGSNDAHGQAVQLEQGAGSNDAQRQAFGQAVQLEQGAGGGLSYYTINAYRKVILMDPTSDIASRAQVRIDAIGRNIAVIQQNQDAWRQQDEAKRQEAIEMDAAALSK